MSTEKTTKNKGLGDAFGPGQPLQVLAEDGSGLSAHIPIAPSHSATLCDRLGFHAFIYAGGTMPDGWPCECGSQQHKAS